MTTNRYNSRRIGALVLGATLALTGIAGMVSAGALIDNGPDAGLFMEAGGTVALGVEDLGQINVPGGPATPATGETIVGLRHVPDGNEGTSHGCVCEGWGVHDTFSGTSGYIDTTAGTSGIPAPVVNILPIAFAADGVTALSHVAVPHAAGGPLFEVFHSFIPSVSPNLYRIDVRVVNVGDSPAHALSRRMMDWDVDPTPFTEHVTIDDYGTTPAALLYSNNDGFVSGDPASSPTSGFVPEILGPGSISGGPAFFDAGPDDHGAHFDLDLGPLGPGESAAFVMFYGAARHEFAALAALSDVGAELYSFGQHEGATVGGGGGGGPPPEPSEALPNGPVGGFSSDPSDGTPTTFIWAFKGIGGEPAPSDPCPPPSGVNAWFLEEIEHPILGAPYLLMCQGDHLPPSGSDMVTIPDGKCRVWASNESTPGPFTFNRNGWYGNMDASEGTVPDFKKVYDSRVGFFDPFSPPGSPETPTSPTPYESDGITRYRADGPTREVGVVAAASPAVGGTWTVPAGGYVLYIHCDLADARGVSLELITDGGSWISASFDEPTFPTPELATLVLSAAGVLALGAVALRRRF